MDVLSRVDGSFYVRDAPHNPSLTSSEPFYGTLVFGLFGDKDSNSHETILRLRRCPVHVDNPLPSYSRSINWGGQYQGWRQQHWLV